MASQQATTAFVQVGQEIKPSAVVRYSAISRLTSSK
jgi:hypothetical protein